MKDNYFESLFEEKERAAWIAFKQVVLNFLEGDLFSPPALKQLEVKYCRGEVPQRVGASSIREGFDRRRRLLGGKLFSAGPTTRREPTYYKQYSRDMTLFDGSLATSLFGKVRGLLFDVVGEKRVEWGGRLNFMLRHQEFLSDDDEMEKRDPPASYSADSGLLSAAGGAVLFRDSNPTPCSCYSDNLPPSYRDLGLGVYPRYLSDVTCNYSSCGSSLYRCQPLNHTIFVLKSKNAVEQMDTSDSDRLPKPLRSKWRFEGINITVACVCQRYHSNG
ncbi:hypothetical protein ANN_13969 [Periplaneta americana]|uniref:Prothoracicotropic hormone n=1 Tax=Periplaneta americana TaxID=6978 RepID=A0ABQ8SX55_PERAM|nr:hypothetical protein ANN_13969 [Periplaneta americana]